MDVYTTTSNENENGALRNLCCVRLWIGVLGVTQVDPSAGGSSLPPSSRAAVTEFTAALPLLAQRPAKMKLWTSEHVFK